jgi:hypothetical protein
MAASKMIRVTYNGTDIGPIYIGDAGRRPGLGGGESVYGIGQDRYIRKGEARNFVFTGDVALSYDRGIIKHYSTAGAEARFLGVAPISVAEADNFGAEVFVAPSTF